MRAALTIAARGMAIFPLLPGTKRPAVRRDWEGCATTDVEQIERWWFRAPYNIGVATGPSRLVVVDLDAPHGSADEENWHGRQVLAALARQDGAEIPRETFTVVTPGGGQHLYFSAPAGRSLGNTAGRLGPSIDTRAVGGYVVGPGSRIGDRSYRVIHEARPAEVPSWLLARLRPRLTDRPVQPPTFHAAYVEAAIRDEARQVAEAKPGRRNTALFQASSNLSRFVRDGRLTENDVRASLSAAAARHVGTEGFSAHEVSRTIESGLRRGNASGSSPRAQNGRAPNPCPSR